MTIPSARAVLGFLVILAHILLVSGAALGEIKVSSETAVAVAQDAFQLTISPPPGNVLAARADPMGNKTNLYCGIFSSASKRDVMNMLYAFKHKHHKDSGHTCGAAAKSCLRQSCDNTSGLYLCNDNDYPVSIDCYQMAMWMSDVGGCCPKNWEISKGISGQEFSDQGWNVVIAYANCNHAPDADRPGDFQKWGPNGQCES